MIIGIVGAGAVGGYYGAKLRKAGYEVVFLTRGSHLEAMKRDGLQISSKNFGFFQVDGIFTDNMNDLREADLLLFTVKSTETKSAAEELFPILKEEAVLLTLQNGVDNEEVLVQVFGEERVLSGAAYVSSKVDSPGVIKQSGSQTLLIDPLHPSKEDYVQFLSSQFKSAGIECKTSNQVLYKKWDKLLWNVTFNPLSAAAMVTVGEILDNPRLRKTAEKVLEEASNVGRAMSIPLRQELINQIIPSSDIVRSHKTSMLQDRERGREMEIESICGYLVKKAAEHSLEVPVLYTLYTLLLMVNEKRDSRI